MPLTLLYDRESEPLVYIMYIEQTKQNGGRETARREKQRDRTADGR